MNLIYNLDDKPKFGQLIVFAFQQVLAILAATIAVPAIIGNGMSQSAALFGAGVGTLVYQLFTRFKSPVFLGSSFAFIGSMLAAFAGATSVGMGYIGLIIGAICAGLVYVVIAVVVKFVGVGWIEKLMPAVVIGPTVAIIGLSLAGNAVGDMTTGGLKVDGASVCSPYVALVCALVTLFVVILCSHYGKKMAKLIPFILGILAGYAVALIFTLIGDAMSIDALKVIDFGAFKALFANGVTFGTFVAIPDFTFVTALGSVSEFNWAYVGTIAAAYVPVAFVVFAEHIADHKNLSTIIGKNLLEEPGLSRTLLGDGVGSMVGALFGGCPNTTYGESVGCVAITRNASVVTIMTTAIMTILISFVSPFVAFLSTIPNCVMGGVCMTLYGFIAVSGLKMVQKVDLEQNKNVFTVSVILIAGIGGLTLSFGSINITSIACALILGILVNVVLNLKKEPVVDDTNADEE
jgi:uracil permease